MTSRCVGRFGGWVATLVLVVSFAAHADEMDPFGGQALKPGQKHDGKVLTVDELIACIDLQRDLHGQESRADSLELSVDLAESRYRGLAQIIDAERRTLDATDQHAIDDFNAKVREQGAAVDAYNDLVVQLNGALSKQDALAGQFNAQCTASAYYASDLTRAYSIRERRLAESIARESGKRDGNR